MIGTTFWSKTLAFFTILSYPSSHNQGSEKWSLPIVVTFQIQPVSTSMIIGERVAAWTTQVKEKHVFGVNHVFPIHSGFASRISCFKNYCVFLFFSPDSWPSIPKFQKVQYSDSQANTFFQNETSKSVWVMEIYTQKIRTRRKQSDKLFSTSTECSPKSLASSRVDAMNWLRKNTFDKGGWKNNIFSPILGWYKKNTHMYTYTIDHICMYIIMKTFTYT